MPDTATQTSFSSPALDKVSGNWLRSTVTPNMINDLAKIPLEFSPGEAWNYSVATDVVGYLIGKISGKPFEHFLKERILDPLGMKRAISSVQM